MIRKYISLAILLVTFTACEIDQDPTNARTDFLGQWLCSEVEGDFAPQNYAILVDPVGSESLVDIKGLYNLGPTFVVRAEVQGSGIYITTQTSNGITIAGTGSINSNLDEVTLNFTADDGSGADNVKAIWTR